MSHLVPRRGRPPRSPLFARRYKFMVSMTDEERFALHHIADVESARRGRRIWPGEMCAVALKEQYPEQWVEAVAKYQEDLAARQSRPLTELEVAEEMLRRGDAEEADRKRQGLPDMKAFYEQYGIGPDDPRYKKW